MRRKRRGQNQTEDERLKRNGLPLFSRAAYVYDCPNGIGFVGMAYLMSQTRFPIIGFVFLLGFLNVQSNVAAHFAVVSTIKTNFQALKDAWKF